MMSMSGLVLRVALAAATPFIRGIETRRPSPARTRARIQSMMITVTFRHDPAELEQEDANTLADELPDELTAARRLTAELRGVEDGDTIDLDIDAGVAALLTLMHMATRTRTGRQRELPSPGLRELRRILEHGVWPRAAERR
jgi:hypothetical protein